LANTLLLLVVVAVVLGRLYPVIQAAPVVVVVVPALALVDLGHQNKAPLVERGQPLARLMVVVVAVVLTAPGQTQPDQLPGMAARAHQTASQAQRSHVPVVVVVVPRGERWVQVVPGVAVPDRWEFQHPTRPQAPLILVVAVAVPAIQPVVQVHLAALAVQESL